MKGVRFKNVKRDYHGFGPKDRYTEHLRSVYCSSLATVATDMSRKWDMLLSVLATRWALCPLAPFDSRNLK